MCLISILGISFENIAKVAFPKENKYEETCKRKPIQKRSVFTHAYAEVRVV